MISFARSMFLIAAIILIPFPSSLLFSCTFASLDNSPAEYCLLSLTYIIFPAAKLKHSQENGPATHLDLKCLMQHSLSYISYIANLMKENDLRHFCLIVRDSILPVYHSLSCSRWFARFFLPPPLSPSEKRR